MAGPPSALAPRPLPWPAPATLPPPLLPLLPLLLLLAAPGGPGGAHGEWGPARPGPTWRRRPAPPPGLRGPARGSRAHVRVCRVCTRTCARGGGGAPARAYVRLERGVFTHVRAPAGWVCLYTGVARVGGVQVCARASACTCVCARARLGGAGVQPVGSREPRPRGCGCSRRGALNPRAAIPQRPDRLLEAPLNASGRPGAEGRQ